MGQQFSYEERIEYLKNHGSQSLAYSTLQPGMRYFDMPGVGYIAFVQYCGTRFVLSDPICDETRTPEILSAFLLQSDDALFAQIHEHTARILQDSRGFFVSAFGVENVIHTDDFEITWRVRRDLKRWLSALSKKGICVREGQEERNLQEMARVSAQWILAKAVKHELAFLARPFSIAMEPGARRFFASIDGQVVAFCTFDPCYSHGTTVAYALNHMRSAGSDLNGILDYTVVQAVRTLSQEGIGVINLGVSPLHGRDNSTFRSARMTDIISDIMYRYGNRLYGFKALGFHKDRYCPEKRQVYLASRRRFTLFEILKLLRVNRVL